MLIFIASQKTALLVAFTNGTCDLHNIPYRHRLALLTTNQPRAVGSLVYIHIGLRLGELLYQNAAILSGCLILACRVAGCDRLLCLLDTEPAFSRHSRFAH